MLKEASPDGVRVNTITLAFTLLAGTIVFLRLFTRLVLTKGAGFEDALIAIAMVTSIRLPTSATLALLTTPADLVDWFCCSHFRASNARPRNARQ